MVYIPVTQTTVTEIRDDNLSNLNRGCVYTNASPLFSSNIFTVAKPRRYNLHSPYTSNPDTQRVARHDSL